MPHELTTLLGDTSLTWTERRTRLQGWSGPDADQADATPGRATRRRGGLRDRRARWSRDEFSAGARRVRRMRAGRRVRREPPRRMALHP
jgi:hypothetical protein